MSQFETITQIGDAEMSEKAKIAFAALSTALVVFSLYTAMFGVFPDMIQRGAHISAVIGLVYVRLFGLDSVSGLSWSRIKFFGLGVIGSAVLGYQFFFYEDVFSLPVFAKIKA